MKQNFFVRAHTQTHTETHINEGSIFISELLHVKLRVWLSQEFEIIE